MMNTQNLTLGKRRKLILNIILEHEPRPEAFLAFIPTGAENIGRPQENTKPDIGKATKVNLKYKSRA